LSASVDYLRECVAYLALRGDLIVADHVIATDDFLGSLNDLVLEDVETLLKLVQTGGHLGFLLCELGVLADLRLNLVLDISLNLAEVILSDIQLRSELQLNSVLIVVTREVYRAATLGSFKVIGDRTATLTKFSPVKVESLEHG